MPVLTPCPSAHNNAWRKAEALGLPHELTPTWGTPIHCLGCTGRAYHQLSELPELLAAVWLEAIHGTKASSQTGTIGRIGLNATWPGQSARMMTDLIVGGLTELEDDLRDLRHLGHRPDRGREGQTATGAVTFLLVHLEWALVHHPAATEPHDRDSANPASQIGYWHRAATRFTRRDARLEQRTAPCPKCDWRSLFFGDGEDYIACRNPACENLMTETEYNAWSKELADKYKLEQQAGAEDRFAVISATAECAQEATAA
jgi:hypothetical protein